MEIYAPGTGGKRERRDVSIEEIAANLANGGIEARIVLGRSGDRRYTDAVPIVEFMPHWFSQRECDEAVSAALDDPYSGEE